MNRGTIRFTPPNRELIQSYATERKIHASDEQLEFATTFIQALLRRLEDLTDQKVPLRYPDRDRGRIPTPEEDPYNSIIRLCEVNGALDGPLSGMRIGIKDHIAVANIPMTQGKEQAITLIPSEDAIVVERLLDAGAKIVAKTNMTLDGVKYGIPRNPLNPQFATGASSSGSAAAVSGGLVDAALGSDSGGSIRNPAAFCGIVGIKPTYGLVPLHGTGCFGHSLCQVGPMTTTVADNAAILEVIAGRDLRDSSAVAPRPMIGDYTEVADSGVNGLRIGVITESLEPWGCSAKTLTAFEESQKTLRTLGAELIPISVPLWLDVGAIFWPIYNLAKVGIPAHFKWGGYASHVDIRLASDMTTEDRLSSNVGLFPGPLALLMNMCFDDANLSLPFVFAQNLRIKLIKHIESLFDDLDLLLTPTWPTTAPKLADSREKEARPQGARKKVDSASSGFGMPNGFGMRNSLPNLTGHPALTIPAPAGDNDLPTGLQIIGRMFDERTVYRAGFAFESAWR